MSLRAALNRIRLFRDFEPSVLDEIAQHADWFTLIGGSVLYQQGETPDAFYAVLTGSLVVLQSGGLDNPQAVAFIRPGEVLGERSLLLGEQHLATVCAMRHTEMIRLDASLFQRLVRTHASFAHALARLAMTRNHRRRQERSDPQIYALIATSPSIDIRALGEGLAKRLAAFGRTCRLYTEDDAVRGATELDRIIAAQGIVLMIVRMRDTSRYWFALRHADRFVVFARKDAKPSTPMPLVPGNETPARRFRLVDLVLIDEGARPGATTRDWMEAVGATRVFHWRGEPDTDRLARIIAGRSVGLVLSGGGARAYAHIGVLRALQEAGVKPDLVGGASMGAILGAGLAAGWTFDEMTARVREAFVKSDPLGDHVLPVVAFTRGRRVEKRLAAHFGDTRIEDLQTPFFCVSLDLIGGEVQVYRKGLVREALRASVSLPGILPPVVEDNQILVDGGVMNNLPMDVMRPLHHGVTVGVDAAEEPGLRMADFVNPPGFLSWIVRHGLSSPPIVSLLMRATTVRRNRVMADSPAELIIRPKLGGFEIRDWRRFDEAVEAGYRAAVAELARRPLSSWFAQFEERKRPKGSATADDPEGEPHSWETHL